MNHPESVLYRVFNLPEDLSGCKLCSKRHDIACRQVSIAYSSKLLSSFAIQARLSCFTPADFLQVCRLRTETGGELPSNFVLRVFPVKSGPCLPSCFTPAVFLQALPSTVCTQELVQKPPPESELHSSSAGLAAGRARVQTAADKKRHLAEGTLPFLNAAADVAN